MPRAAESVDQSTYVGRVAARIRARREGLGLTGEQAARDAGLPINTWFRWESGKTAVPLERLPQVAKVLRCAVSDLLPSR